MLSAHPGWLLHQFLLCVWSVTSSYSRSLPRPFNGYVIWLCISFQWESMSEYCSIIRSCNIDDLRCRAWGLNKDLNISFSQPDAFFFGICLLHGPILHSDTRLKLSERWELWLLLHLVDNIVKWEYLPFIRVQHQLLVKRIGLMNLTMERWDNRMCRKHDSITH